MSAFESIRTAARRTAEKITDRASILADSAATALKIRSLEARLSEQYENLGRLVYRGLHTAEELSDEKLRILSELDSLHAQLEALRAQQNAANASGDTAHDAEHDAAHGAACQAETAPDGCCETGETAHGGTDAAGGPSEPPAV